jgi:hypothetical protein
MLIVNRETLLSLSIGPIVILKKDLFCHPEERSDVGSQAPSTGCNDLIYQNEAI